MGRLKNLYDGIKNPLEDDKNIERLLRAYTKKRSSFYAMIVNTSERDSGGHINARDKAEFYINTFNLWRENVLNLSEKQIETLEKAGYTDMARLKALLQNTAPVTSLEEIASLKKNELINDNSWDHVNDSNAWEHVMSRYIAAGWESKIDVRHRLYIDCSDIDIYKIANLLMEKCRDRNLSFYFKFSDTDRYREDKIILYSDTENLLNYIEILEEMGMEHPDIVKRCGDIPVLSGSVNEWIGIGDEPRPINGRNRSFNQVRSSIIEKSISDVTISNISKYLDQTVMLDGKEEIFSDLIVEAGIDGILEHLSLLSKVGVDIEKTKGLSPVDLTSDALRNHLRDHIKNNIQDILKEITSEDASINFSVPTKDGKSVKFGSNEMQQTIQQMIPVLLRINPNFSEEVRSLIYSNAISEGIDISKFCFDEGTKESFEERDYIASVNASMNEMKELILEDLSKCEKLKLYTPMIEAFLDHYKKECIGLDKIDEYTLEGFIAALSIRCSAQKVNNLEEAQKLLHALEDYTKELSEDSHNAISVDAKLYIEEFIAPHIPESGEFILSSNGMKISAKQYIEEFVLSSPDFNGDINYLLETTTKANNGFINIGEDDFIPSIDISKHLNPELLDRRITLQNGAAISARQYVEEFIAPHIPESGEFILSSNGMKISAKQYIEEFVLSSPDFSDDINSLLEDTTKANDGFINIQGSNEAIPADEITGSLNPALLESDILITDDTYDTNEISYIEVEDHSQNFAGDSSDDGLEY